MSRKRLGLALGGGAARGMAHVGVLEVLDREGIEVECIAGSSVGSIVGAAYAAGLRGQALAQAAMDLRWRDVARPVVSRDGLLTFAPLEATMVRLLGDLAFDDLLMPYSALAAELATARPVVLRRGRVARAVRASCSVPGLVTPVEWGGQWLVDGGALNNLPIGPVRDLGADVVVAVSLWQPSGHRPRGVGQIVVASIEGLIAGAGDDPAGADAHIAMPFSGLGSLVRLSRRTTTMALGQEMAERALPAIRRALGCD